MPPKKKPGPVPRHRRSVVGSHQKNLEFPLLTNFLENHVSDIDSTQTEEYITSKDIYSSYKRWLARVAVGRIKDDVMTMVEKENRLKTFTRQMLKHRCILKHWNHQRHHAPLRITIPQRREVITQSRSSLSIYYKQQYHSDDPIVREKSRLTGVEYGMFSTRMIFQNEVITEYKGTMQRLRGSRLNKLLTQVDGGILNLKGQVQQPVSDVTKTYDVFNPYVINTISHTVKTSQGTWANHSPTIASGCNMTIVKVPAGQSLRSRFFFIAASDIAKGTELLFDYGLRLIDQPWTMPVLIL